MEARREEPKGDVGKGQEKNSSWWGSLKQVFGEQECLQFIFNNSFIEV